jgi:hypothetical protein
MQKLQDIEETIVRLALGEQSEQTCKAVAVLSRTRNAIIDDELLRIEAATADREASWD